MKKVLFVALLGALAGPAWAQEIPPEPPAPPVPPPAPAVLFAQPPAAPPPAPGVLFAQAPPAPPAPVSAPAARPAQAPPAAPAPRPAPVAPVAPSPRPATAQPGRGAVPVAPAPPAAPEAARIPRNVRFDITITDTAGGKTVTKALSVTVSDVGGNGSIRSWGNLPVGNPVPLNVDVRNVAWFNDGTVRANVNVEYQAYVPDAKPQPGLVTATATTVFQDGRKTQILQAADPTSDRRTSIDVTATVLK